MQDGARAQPWNVERQKTISITGTPSLATK